MKPPAAPTESDIRDADLLAQLAQHARGFGRDTMVRVLADTQARRDAERARLVAMPRNQRQRAETASQLAAATPQLQDLRHIHSVLAICGLPYKRAPLEQRKYERRQGQMKLVVEAGELTAPDTGEDMVQPIPFGPKARLLMMHLCSEAIQQKSATIEIADNLTAFLREIGYPATGGKRGTLHAFKEQINALAAARMKIAVWNGAQAKQRYIQPFSEADVWLPLDPRERMLWPTTLTFSLDFYDSLKRHALPINAQAVRAFAGSARRLDLYFWLGWRMNNIREPLQMSWAALAEQFGTDYAEQRKFRRDFIADLAAVREIFPKLPAVLDENGLRLTHAAPDTLFLPTPRKTGKA